MKNQSVAIVTGANRGIGKAVVAQLLTEGFRTILTSRNETSGLEAYEELKSKGDLYYHVLDVNSIESVEALKDWIVEKFGRLDVLINNAGINYDNWNQPSTVDLDYVKKTLETNLFGVWRMCQAFVPMMKKQQYGRIVNVSSGLGALQEMNSSEPAYGLSKTALNVLTIKLAKELEGTGILVNAVSPGWVRTAMGGNEAPRSVEEGAETIVWLAQRSSTGLTGKFFRDKKVISY